MAQELGISKPAVYHRLKVLGITPDVPKWNSEYSDEQFEAVKNYRRKNARKANVPNQVN